MCLKSYCVLCNYIELVPRDRRLRSNEQFFRVMVWDAPQSEKNGLIQSPGPIFLFAFFTKQSQEAPSFKYFTRLYFFSEKIVKAHLILS